MATKLSHAGLATHYTNDTDVDDQLQRKFNSPMSPSIELATTYERPPSGYAGGILSIMQPNKEAIRGFHGSARNDKS